MRKKHDNIRLYHVDHLGSTSLVTDIDGEITQHVAYIPYGEVFVEQRNGSWNTPYLFNAKELDEETGLYYYGARYLDPTNAAWLSVDPLFEKYVGTSPYNYCHGNPIVVVDPDGMDEYGLDENTGRLSFIRKTESEKDKILVGTWGKDKKTNKDVFTAAKNGKSLSISAKILEEKNQNVDISTKGIVMTPGNDADAAKLLKFISFNCYKEVVLWAYKNFCTKEDMGTEIEPWDRNTFNHGVFRKKGHQNVEFHVHTHPGHRDEKNNPGWGKGVPSDTDYDTAKKHFAGIKHFIVPREGNPTFYRTYNSYGEDENQYFPATSLSFKSNKRFHTMFPSTKK